MKTFIRNCVYLFTACILMAESCARDEKEPYVDEDESYRKTMYGTRDEIAAQEWEKCKATADRLISIAESNLKTLRSNITVANEYEKAQLDIAYEQNNIILNQLRYEMQRHDLIFQKGVTKVDEVTFASFRNFNNFLLNELVDLNSGLEEIIE